MLATERGLHNIKSLYMLMLKCTESRLQLREPNRASLGASTRAAEFSPRAGKDDELTWHILCAVCKGGRSKNESLLCVINSAEQIASYITDIVIMQGHDTEGHEAALSQKSQSAC